MGDTGITLVTPADAANFTVGEIAHLYTGQLVPGSNNEPDAEMKIVADWNDSTGEVNFTTPLTRDYVQEYYISGTSGATKRTDTGGLTPAPLGIAPVEHATLRHFGIQNLVVETRTTGTHAAVR